MKSATRTDTMTSVPLMRDEADDDASGALEVAEESQ